MADWRKDPKVGFILVVIIVIFLAVTYQRIKPKKNYFPADFKCEQCENVFSVKVYGGQKLPLKCPKCGKAAAYRAVKCTECGFVFTIKSQPPPEGPPPMTEITKCPKCGSAKLGLVTSGKPLYEQR